MKVSVILAHLHPGFFNHEIAAESAALLRNAGHRVIVHDLYREQFDPLLLYNGIPRNAPLPRQLPCTAGEIAAADGIVFVHSAGQPHPYHE